MIGTADLGRDVMSLGELLGLLTPDGDGATVNTAWFRDPAISLETIGARLQYLVSVADSILGPGVADGPDVFSGARWYPLPNPVSGGSTPFCLVSSPPAAVSGQIGLGVVYPIELGNLTIQAFGYVPLLAYGPSGYGQYGAQFIADSENYPSQVGLFATTTDSSLFTVTDGPSTVTFRSMTMEAEIYLSGNVPSFKLSFDQLTGTTKTGPFTSLSALLDPDVESWIAEVMLQGSYWLNLYVGSSSITVGQVLVAANFLNQDGETGDYSLNLSQLHGQTPLQIALNFVFAGLDALANLEVPLLPLPGGGIFVASDHSGDYGVRFATDLAVTTPTTTDGKSSPGFTLSLGTWLTGETNATSWISRTTGGTRTPEPGLSVYLLSRDPASNGLSFKPSFELASVGINIMGGPDAPLVNLSGYSIGGAELRGYLSSNDWDFGFATRIDSVGFPLGPSFADAQDGSGTQNAIAKNLIASDGQTSDGGQQNAVNPVFSAEVGYMKGQPPLFELFDPQGQQTDLIWFPVQRRFGPLNCQKVGLKVDVTGTYASDPVLGIVFDGGVQLSGLDVELDQLSISVHLKEASDIHGYSLDLQGLAVAFNSGTVEISGGLMKTIDGNGFISYDGEALIKIGEYAISALGSFGSLKTGGTSLFIFAALNTPLGGPPFFFVTGLALGFGYNRALKLPAQGDVQKFPLVAAMGNSAAIGGDNPTPATVLATLDSWVPPVKGEYWVAAGIQFTTFEIINTNALLIIEFGNDLTIAVLGTATLKQPLAGPTYVYAELDIELVFAPQQGEFKASAVLSDNSYVLTPQAHLTGGFASYGWFGDNEHAGDFVFTLGGYHPALNKPSWYPDEPRVGINWQISSGLSMVGGAYLAITPTAMMAGASLQITFEDGPLKAWLKATVDAILYYRPFYLVADASISIGVSYSLDLQFVHVTISVEIGADFHLWGPPIGGTVHVNWYIISFTIPFGAEPNPPTTLDWAEFKAMLPSKTTESPHQQQPRRARAMAATRGLAAAAASDTTTIDASLSINAVSGLLRTGTTGSQTGTLTHWLVRAEQFEFSVGSAVPASSLVVRSEEAKDDVTKTGTRVGIRRVNGDIPSANYQSTQTVTILAFKPDSMAADPDGQIKACLATVAGCTGQPAGCTATPVDVTDWDIETVMTKVPEALWGEPVPAGTTPNVNSDTPTIPAVTGLTLAPKVPVITNCTPPMVIDSVFDDRTVNPTDAYRLPLSQTQQPSQPVPVQADSFVDIAHINDDPGAAAQRALLFQALQGLGVNGWTNGDLSTMAANPGKAFADEPLEGAPVLAVVS